MSDNGNSLSIVMLSSKDVARFHRQVVQLDNDDCWPWLGHVNLRGYGNFAFRIQSRVHTVAAHRIAALIAFGSIDRGVNVLHHCDNPRCCNPSHLFLGSQEENMRDCAAKRRTTFGRRANRAKLTDDLVRRLPRVIQSGSSYRKIPTEVGCAWQTVQKAARGLTWKHITANKNPDS